MVCFFVQMPQADVGYDAHDAVGHGRVEFDWHPRSLIIDNAKSIPYRSARSSTARLRSNDGMNRGEVVEISHPLLPIGMNTPTCMMLAFAARGLAQTDPSRMDAAAVPFPRGFALCLPPAVC